jgi:cobalamin biosynthesis protein CobT
MTQDDQAEPRDSNEEETNQEGGNEAPSEGGSEGQPDIENDEQAEIPDGLEDIDPDEVEEAAGASSEESNDQEDSNEDHGEIAEPEESSSTTSSSLVQAGNLYVSVVKSVTNAQIEQYGGPVAQERGDDHFEQYELANCFDATMDELGVGSDMEPHEALLLATVLSVGDGLVTETDVLDQQIGKLMDKAMNGSGGAAA